jgi:hypothetical protein
MDPAVRVLRIERLTSQKWAALRVSMDAALMGGTPNDSFGCGAKRSDRWTRARGLRAVMVEFAPRLDGVSSVGRSLGNMLSPKRMELDEIANACCARRRIAGATGRRKIEATCKDYRNEPRLLAGVGIDVRGGS